MEGVRLRSYQEEMLSASLESNVIVAMDTGSGKTHVAIGRILVELERTSDSDKSIFFLSPSVALALQQAQVLQDNLPSVQVRTLTGLDGVDKWTDQKLWDAVLTNVKVVVATPAVLLDALTHGFIKLARLSLCVFDEAHRATKGHPMNAILQRFYHPAKLAGLETPHILGLSASPVVNSKKGSLETIETNLNARAVTPKQHRGELETYVNPPEFVAVSYTRSTAADTGSLDPLCKALTAAANSYDLSSDPYVIELRERGDERASKELQKVLLKRATYCSEQLRALDLRALSLEVEIGSSMANEYVQTCIRKFQESLQHGNSFIMPDLSENERRHLAAIFTTCLHYESRVNGDSDLSVSHKAEQLIAVLKAQDAASVRGIIFVEQRAHVAMLARLLRQLPEIASFYKIGSFVGTSTSSRRKMSVADLSELKEQQGDLDAFRKGEKNLMIATTVLEEGIDVSACNLVICFEPPKNLVSFVQRRGRARQKHSKYFLFIAEDDMRTSGKRWSDLEATMKAAYRDDSRKLEEDVDDEYELSDKTYHVPSTGALLTIENAKAHLYHFCSVGTSHSSQYVDLRPEFDTIQDSRTEEWTASVDLPAFVTPDLRHFTSSKPYKVEIEAIKDAAFEAYIALHKAGLVNDNLLPLIKDYGPDVGQQHLDQPSLVQVSQREPSWKLTWESRDATESHWYSNEVSIALKDQILVTMQAWTPNPMPLTEDFDLFWNADVTYRAKFSPRHAKPLNVQALTLARQCTDHILRSVHGSRMLGSSNDFPVLFTPDVAGDGLQQWLDSLQGQHSVIDSHEDGSNHLEAGLIRIKGQGGRPFFLHGYPEQHGDIPQLVVSNFPKRKDFLHPVPRDAGPVAYTGRQVLVAGDCTIDSLPAKFALFAAFVPSLLHRMDITVLAQSLEDNLLSAVGIRNKSLLLEAISSPAAGEAKDYNRLEYLGDTVLKHCTELQVIAQHTNWPEAYLTLERDRIVRNSNLAKAAMDIGLDRFILTKAFTGAKWKPEDLLFSAPETREISTKTLADVFEALIGAAFVEGGLDKALNCLKVLLPTEMWKPPAECFDILLGNLGPTDYKNRDLLERLIGHRFAQPTLLVEAITHVSFPYNRTGLSYERIEFFGDSVLDMLITPQLFAHSRNLKHWELHRLHEALVNSHFLGYCCLRYAVNEQKYEIVEKDPGHDIDTSTRFVHLHDFLRMSYQLLPLRQKTMANFEKLQATIDGALEHSREYPWCELMTLNLPKFFCDIIESVLGAIFIDTRGNLAACEVFAEHLGIMKYMRRILEDRVEAINPKERLGMVADRDEVQYVNSQYEDEEGVKRCACTVRVGDEEVSTSRGCGSREEAEVKAASQACKVLERKERPSRKRELGIAQMEDSDRMEIDGASPPADEGAETV